MLTHGDNLLQKIHHKTKYRDEKSRLFLKEILAKYEKWRADNLKLKGPFAKESDQDKDALKERLRLFSEYKDFIDQQKYAENFDSRSNLHSTVLEEFIYYLFKDLVEDFSKFALFGKAHTFKDIFFLPPNFKEMITKPYARIEIKDHDFVIGVNINCAFRCEASKEKDKVEIHNLQIPAVVIECKTYLDKTMLEGSSNAAEQLKVRNPNAIYLVVMEWLKLTEDVNLGKYKVDQIYVLRKQKNTDREFRFLPDYIKKPIHLDVITHLYSFVRNYLNSDWEKSVIYGLDRGWLK
jgi:hypothetical protein